MSTTKNYIDMIDALHEIDKWWDDSDPTKVVPAKMPNELNRNDSMAAYAIINAKKVFQEFKQNNKWYREMVQK